MNGDVTGTSDNTRIVRRICPDIAESLHEHPLVHRLLGSRGVASKREFEAHTGDLPGPEDLPDIDLAVQRLLQARTRDEYVLVVGDYDCDGATSSALALLGLQAMGFTRLGVIVPNRFHDGYGLSEGLLHRVIAGQARILSAPGTRLPDARPDVILTVDNGVASIVAVEAASAAGIDVVITDHHLPGDVLPAAVALVNPNRADATFVTGALAGVGVMFFVLLAIRAELRRLGDPAAGVNLAQWLDLVAVGTLADLVPLDRVNRILVEQGLRRIRAGRARPGLLALLQLAQVEPATLGATDIGFAIGPRLNAAGRLDDMRAGIECLVAPDTITAMQAALKLDAMNSERRQIEARMRRDAESQLNAALTSMPVAGHETGRMAERAARDALGLVLFDETWHEGVIGILAGRIKDQQHRPVAVFAASHDSDSESPIVLKGSVRSIAQVHIRDVLVRIDTANPNLILRFGGHAMAAGLSIARDNLDEFCARFEAEVDRRLGGRLPGREFITDGPLSSHDIVLPMARLLRTLAPWGMQFDAPLFDGLFEVIDSRIVGHHHLKLRVQALDDQQRPEGPVLDAIAFRQGDAAHLAMAATGARLQLVYELSINRFRDRDSVQLLVHLVQAGG